MRDVLSFLRPYRWRFLAGSLLRVSGDLVYLYNIFALSSLIAAAGHGVVGGSTDKIWFLLFAWATTYVYVHTSRQLAKYICYQIAEKINLDGQLTALRHLNFLDIAWHEKENRRGTVLRKAATTWPFSFSSTFTLRLSGRRLRNYRKFPRILLFHGIIWPG